MPTVEMRVALGSKVRDALTGIEGIAVAFDFWKNGCKRYGIQPLAQQDGKVPDIRWAEEADVIVLQVPNVKPAKPPTGGPMDDPPSRFSK